MKKILILLILAFSLIGCQTNRNVDGYVKIKSTTHNDTFIYYFDPNEYEFYDSDRYMALNENGYDYVYVKIDTMPFYELANKKEVTIYSTGRNSYEIFVKASDIHTIKIEV